MPVLTGQLRFDLPVQVALGTEDYFVSDANAQAHAMVMDWQGWPGAKLALIGPAGSGKSHLARVWQAMTGAMLLRAAAITDAPMPPPGTALVIEDMAGLPPSAEEPLFYLHNHLAQTGGHLLLTAADPPSRWPIRLADLASRMQATAVVRLSDPDDRLLAALLMKLFADRQIAPAPDVIHYLAARIERSHAAAARVVAQLDTAGMATGRSLTRAFVRSVLDKPGRDAPE